MQTTAIDPLKLKLADLEVLEAQPKTLAIVEPAPARPVLTRRDAKQQILGAMRMINHFSGAQMHREIDTVEFLSARVDELEAQLKAERDRFEAEKLHYRQALTAVGKVIDLYSGDPFELKPISKWSKATPKTPYSEENTGFNFDLVKAIEPYVASTPTSCQMKRP